METAIDSLRGNLQYKQGAIPATSFKAIVSTIRKILYNMSSSSYTILVISHRIVLNAIEIGKNTFNVSFSYLASKADPKGGPSGITRPIMTGPRTYFIWKTVV